MKKPARTTWRKAVDLIRHASNEWSGGCSPEGRGGDPQSQSRYAALCDNQYDADEEAPGVVVVPVPIRAEFSVARDQARVR
jgi:hypothetical protein